MKKGQFVELVDCPGKLYEIASVTDGKYILVGTPGVEYPEEALRPVDIHQVRVEYYPAGTRILTFTQEDTAEYIWAVDGYRYWSALTDLQDKIRSLWKYSNRESIPVEELRELFFGVLEDNHVDLNKVE